MLTVLLGAAVVLAATDQPPTYGEARQCTALLNASYSQLPDEAAKKRNISASTYWGQLAAKLGKAEGRTDRQMRMLLIGDTDEAKAKIGSTDSAVRAATLAEAETCTVRALSETPEA